LTLEFKGGDRQNCNLSKAAYIKERKEKEKKDGGDERFGGGGGSWEKFRINGSIRRSEQTRCLPKLRWRKSVYMSRGNQ